MRFSATRTIPASSSDVFRTLGDIRSLASWNPALSDIHSTACGVTVGERYRTRIRGAIPASIVFTHLGEGEVRYRMDALGSHEVGTWAWVEEGRGRTTVAHSFEHGGLLINLMSRAFEQVPGWRLRRLEEATARQVTRS